VERPTWAPREIDLERPSAARMYDYYLGGSHNFEVDRTTAQEAMRAMPDMPMIMQANRAFLRRAVRFLAEAGVTQFIDIGSGIPTVGNVHEVVHDVDPSRQVVYVDIDPIAVAHSRAILAGNPNATIIQADLLRPDEILEHPELLAALDRERPTAVMLNAVLHFVSDSEAPGTILARFRDALAPGSYLSISHATDIGAHEKVDEAVEIYKRTPTPVYMRTKEEVTELFKGWSLVEPGVTLIPHWRPETHEPTDEAYARKISMFGGVGLAI
jgi:S-adenosyl methyltransferase